MIQSSLARCLERIEGDDSDPSLVISPVGYNGERWTLPYFRAIWKSSINFLNVSVSVNASLSVNVSTCVVRILDMVFEQSPGLEKHCARFNK